jgi:5-hydroxyisourate hydrolase-like protein (transthyretin family)
MRSIHGMTRVLASIVLVTFGTLIAARVAEGCTCVESGAACEDYWKASAVFLGRVESIARQPVKPPARMPGSRRVTLAVLEPFSGVQKGTVEITTGSGGGDCGFAFREGGQYVVYAQRSEPGAPLTVSICSRTREVAEATADLEYARAVASGVPVQARISGDVLLGTRSLSRGPVREPRPLPDVSVRLERDGQSTRVVTGADGRFSAEGLAAGRYTATIDLPDGLYAEGWPKTIDLRDARSCAEVHATTFVDGRVTGRAVDSSGRPVAGLTVEVTAPAGLDEPLGPERLRDLTDSDGRFEIVHIPAGRFVVGINTQRNRDGALLEPRLFHPGVPALTGATRINLKAGERVALRDFVLPRDVVFVPISGIVLDADGAPAAGARVYLKGQAEADYILSEPAITDARGRFTLAAIEGRGYRLFAERPRGDASNARIDSSEQIPFTAAPTAAPFKLTLRRRY